VERRIRIAAVVVVVLFVAGFALGSAVNRPGTSASLPTASGIETLTPPPTTTTMATPVPTIGAGPTTVASADGTVTVTGVAANQGSVKIDFKSVPGARDYRVYDTSDPAIVKYAGVVYLSASSNNHFVMEADGVTPVSPFTETANTRTATTPITLDVPNTEIEWNGLTPGIAHTLVVQALDALGPVPQANTYDDNNQSVLSSTVSSGAMVGSNAGPTNDGNFSTNGQGSYTSTVRVIARSAPFVVKANPAARAIPSRPEATQTFFDAFDDSEAAFQKVGTTDPSGGVMTYTLNAGTAKAWNIQYRQADTLDSLPMIQNGHFMDMLFDGGTPHSNIPTHNSHGLMALSPRPTVDFGGGRLLHATMEVDVAESGRRWVAFNLSPANDPLSDWYGNGPINRTDTAFFAQIFPNMLRTDLFTGPTSSSDGSPKGIAISGALGQAPIQGYRTQNFGGNGRGLDNRSRFDLYMTTTHFAVFEDGKLDVQADIPHGGLPFAQARLYFAHYLYHTANDVNELKTYAPWNRYWINTFHWSDERHWDNMGVEVLPASDVPSVHDFSALAQDIHMPVETTPVTTPAAVPATSTPTPTSVPSVTPATTALIVIPAPPVAPAVSPSAIPTLPLGPPVATVVGALPATVLAPRT